MVGIEQKNERATANPSFVSHVANLLECGEPRRL
jgi:hypothetical protein